MAPKIIILQGGEDVNQRTNEAMFRDVRKLSMTGKILIIPWTTDSPDKEAAYSKIYHDYFSQCGFEEVLFLARKEPEREIRRKFSVVDTVYIPGGDTDILYREIERRALQEMLSGFSGVIIGNSAGAIVLSKGGWGDGKYHHGFGLVDLHVSVHYKPGSGNADNTDMCVNIPENMWIAVTH
ncbi:MAG: Type 1 glutamine amidotransferase-like domain-containing protein [Nitrososphaerota archaeon]|nr:Type 1 glutamine amidotransferase-like domain-containing protein [Nitrososphaerota archaeon]